MELPRPARLAGPRRTCDFNRSASPLGSNTITTSPRADVLGDQQFRQSGLAHARGAQHEHVANPFTQVHPDVGFTRLDPVDRRIAAQADGCGHLRTQGAANSSTSKPCCNSGWLSGRRASNRRWVWRWSHWKPRPRNSRSVDHGISVEVTS
jgi:hypothetical protein